MRCPKCHDQELVARTIDDITVDICPRCSGVFCDKGELEALLVSGFHPELAGQDDDALGHDDRRGPCPKCEGLAAMQTRLGTAGQHHDICPHCHGIWLDGGEYENLVHLPAFLRELG